MKTTVWIVAIALIALPSVTKAGDKIQQTQVKPAVTKALAYLAKEGPEFTSDNGRCITCHHGPMTVWAQRHAEQLGYKIDADGYASFEKKILIRYANGKKGPDKNKWRHTLGAFFALAQPSDWDAKNNQKLIDAVAYELKAAQQKDGSWLAAGQFTGQRRPKGEAHLLQTMWNVLSIQRLEPHRKSLAEQREAALKYIRAAKSPKTTDVRAVRLLLERRLGDAGQTQALLKGLLADQLEDGSWPWLANEEGDVWATAVVLYVLAQLGDDVPAGYVAKAQSYLVKLQRDDGTWYALTRMNPEKHDSDIASYFATVWSTLALAESADRQ